MPNTLKYGSYKNSDSEWLGEIPASWPMVLLSQIVTQVKNKNSDLSEKNLLSLSYGRIKRKPIDISGGLLPASFDGYNIIGANDIVLRLTDLQNDHTSLRVGLSPERGIITSAYTTMRPKNSKGAKYLYYLLHTFDIRKGFYGMGSGVRQGLNYDEVKRLKLPLPPDKEQEAIAAFLDEKVAHIDSVIAEAKASIEEYKAWKASIIYEAVTKGLDPDVEMKDSGVEWIGYMPTKWSRTKLSNCFNIVGSGTTPTSDDDSYYIGNINWLQSGDINGGIVKATKKQVSEEAYDKFSALKVYKAPFMAIAMYGASIANTSIVQVDACTNQACCVFSAPNEFIVLEYVFYAVLGAKEELLLSARGGTQPNINQDILKKLMIPIPSKPEQEYIVCSLNFKCGKINELIAEKESLISDLETYKKSLIFEVVTGKRKVV